MPNQPRADNRAHAIRFEDNLWADLAAIAEDDGVSTSEAARDAVRRYVKERYSEPPASHNEIMAEEHSQAASKAAREAVKRYVKALDQQH